MLLEVIPSSEEPASYMTFSKKIIIGGKNGIIFPEFDTTPSIVFIQEINFAALTFSKKEQFSSDFGLEAQFYDTGLSINSFSELTVTDLQNLAANK